MPLTKHSTFTWTKVNKSKIKQKRELLPNISMSLCIVSSKNGKNCSWTRTFSIKLKSTQVHVHCTVYNYTLMLYTADLHTHTHTQRMWQTAYLSSSVLCVNLARSSSVLVSPSCCKRATASTTAVLVADWSASQQNIVHFQQLIIQHWQFHKIWQIYIGNVCMKFNLLSNKIANAIANISSTHCTNTYMY